MDLNQLTQNPEQIKQLITLLQSLLPTETDTSVSSDNKTTSFVAKETDTNISSKTKYSQHTNKFLAMPEMNMHKEDAELDKKLAKHAPVARSREYDPITVLCRVCGKKETINPSLVESVGRYKCNKCSSSAG